MSKWPRWGDGVVPPEAHRRAVGLPLAKLLAGEGRKRAAAGGRRKTLSRIRDRVFRGRSILPDQTNRSVPKWNRSYCRPACRSRLFWRYSGGTARKRSTPRARTSRLRATCEVVHVVPIRNRLSRTSRLRATCEGRGIAQNASRWGASGPVGCSGVVGGSKRRGSAQNPWAESKISRGIMPEADLS